MLEIVWTRRAETHLQHVFANLDQVAPPAARAWLEDVGRRAALLATFPEMAPVWREPYRRLLLRRELGLFYTVEGRRIVVAGILPLTMDAESISQRLTQNDWP